MVGTVASGLTLTSKGLGDVGEFSPTDLAWAAGFIDGEGCVGCYYLAKKSAGKRYARLSIQVSQTRLPPLETLVRLFGGRINEEFPRGARQQTWRWSLTGTTNVTNCFEHIKDYLQVKRNDFEEAIELKASGPAFTRI